MMLSPKEFMAEIEQFAQEIKADKPYLRYGQIIFNIIDQNWGVARQIQFEKHIDCFYDDEKVEEFLSCAYDLINTKNKQE